MHIIRNEIPPRHNRLRDNSKLFVEIPDRIATTGSRRHRHQHRRGRVDAKWVDPDRECIQTEAKSTVKNDNKHTPSFLSPPPSSFFTRTSIQRKEFNLSNLFDIYIFFHYYFPWNIQIDGRRRRRRRTRNGPAAARSWRPGLLRRARKFFFLFLLEGNGSLSSPIIPPSLVTTIFHCIYDPSIHSAAPSPFSLLSVRKTRRRRRRGSSPS